MDATYNEADLLWLGDWGIGWVLVFAVLAVVVLVLTAIDARELKPWRRYTLVSLRALVLGAAVTLLLEPALELRHVTRVPNHVEILIDRSESMTLPTSDGETREERVRAALDALGTWIEQHGDAHEFHVRTFGAEVTDSSITALRDEASVSDAPATDLLGAIESIAQRYDRNELGGVVIVSDGIDNQTLAGRVRRGDVLDEATRQLVASLGAPLHTVAAAREGELRDVAIDRVLHDDFAFVRNAVKVEVDVRALGMEATTIPVTLSRMGQPLQTRTVSIEPGTSNYRVEFEFVPEQLGKEVYSVSLPRLDGDAVAANDQSFFVINVIRDKIRVLQVVGRPSWDTRFLRQLLKNNPNVDLVSFFILRTLDDVQRASNREMSLIPFPTDELFREQLGSFDLVIFQNFWFEPYDMRQYLSRVRDYVMNGGGFAMLGGDQSFGIGGYGSTELAEIVPVEMSVGRDAQTGLDLDAFRPVLTSAGARHPLTRLEFDRAQNDALWSSLVDLNGTNVVGRAAPDATVLLEHPTRQAGGVPMPVLAVAERGEGRVMALTTDESWRWSFAFVGAGGTSRVYTSFWNAAIRWLIRDPELNLVQVDIAEEVYDPGAEVAIDVRVFEVDYSPATARDAVVRVFRRPLESLDSPQTEPVLEQPVTTDDRGRARVLLPAAETGAYTVVVQTASSEGEPLEGSEIFLVVARSAELRDIEARTDLLSALADAGGGTMQVLPSLDRASLDLSPARVEQVDRRRLVELWVSPWALALFAVLLGLEWTLRRRWGRL